MNKKIIVYILIGILVLSLLILTIFPGIMHAFKDSGITGKSIKDKCKPGPGYNEESWREHMNHHPNIYNECLS